MDQVAQIREKIDIVSFISEYIQLKKAGKNFHALCPFHGEKTPSFVVSPERQIWHCFGCNLGGDVYTFLMQYERLEFPEALRFLAKQTGVELVQTGYADTAVSGRKDRLYKVNHIAAEFYHYILTKHKAGKQALDYLRNRGINEKVIETFKLGFAPATGRALVRYLLQKKHLQKEDIMDAGLAVSYSNGIADFFKGRLLFPLIDHRDNTLGFSGRLLNEDTGFGGKYINTRDTLIYHKRTHFFGLNITKEAIRKANQAILVEGEFDVMSCFQNGISHVAAVKGTALSEEQVNLLSRYVSKVTICFDGDAAGREAIKRSLPVIAKKGLHTTVVVIPSGKDPDEALRTHPGEFKRAAENDVNVYDYLFDRTLMENSASTPEGKQSIADTLLPVIDDIENAIVKEHYLRKLSTSLQTTYESIVQELEKKKKRTVTDVAKTTQKIPRSREEVLGGYLLALIFQSRDPLKTALIVWGILSAHIGKERAYQKLLRNAVDFSAQGSDLRFDKFHTSVPTELLDTFNTALLFPLPAFSDDIKYMQEAEKTAQQLRTVYIKEKIQRLADQIKLKEQQDGGDDEAADLKTEYIKMVGMLKS